MDHRQLQCCSLFVDYCPRWIVACRCDNKKTSNQIYLPKGRFSARSKKKKTTSLESLKFASLVLQVHKDWILARSTTEQAWSAVRLPQIRTPQRACREHKAFYLSSQVEPSDSALWVKGTTRKQPGTVKLQVGRPITVHFSMPTATHRDFPWSILITALWAAAHRAHRFRLSKIEKTSNSKLSLVNFGQLSVRIFSSGFHQQIRLWFFFHMV